MENQCIWEMRGTWEPQTDKLAEELGISSFLARLLIQRGIDSSTAAHKFLWGEIKDLDSPWTLGGMTEAAQRIEQALADQELIAVYGDYDADGICAVVLLFQCLRDMGCQAVFYVPDRFREGYGLNVPAVQELAAQGCRLLITVDCGINSLQEVGLAGELGIDVIISDHHMPGQQLPPALAIINPKLGSLPDSKNLAGVGVAYQLARALGEKHPNSNQNGSWLALTALATVADIVPLLGDNRILVKEGLRCLETTFNPGLKALLQESGLEGQLLNSWHLGFALAPRLNSAGRLQHARLSIELLLTREERRAQELAQQLCRLNEERKSLEAAIVQEAVGMVEDGEEQGAIVLAGEGWHHGVLGIAASRLCARYRKPVIMLSWEGETGRGSARSLEGYNILEALSACRDDLIRFGGHSMAAGLSLERGQFEDFKSAICTWADRIHEQNPDLHKKRWMIDATLDPEELKTDLVRDLELLKPFGEGNPGPVFALRGVQLEKRLLVGKERQHFKACLAGEAVDCIAFNRPDYFNFPHQELMIDLLANLEENEFRGRKSLQLKVVEMKASIISDRGGSQEPTRRMSILLTMREQLQLQRAVLLVFPTLRVLQREKYWLESFFPSPTMSEVHGGQPPLNRTRALNDLRGGKVGIFLTTRAFVDHHQQQLAGNSDLYYCIEMGNREVSAACKSGIRPASTLHAGPDLVTWELASWNFPQEQRSLVYANRKATVDRIFSQWPEIILESGLADGRLRQAAYRQFYERKAGILLSDGGCIGGLHSQWNVDQVLFADAPFSLSEAALLLANLDADQQPRAGVLFSPQALEANRFFLCRIYPVLSSIRQVWSGLSSLGDQLIQGTPAQLAGQISSRTGSVVEGLEFLSSLRILEDLDLCQLEKKGSIMAIKVMKRDHLQVDLSDSAYYLEGLAEKAALASFENSIKSSLDW